MVLLIIQVVALQLDPQAQRKAQLAVLQQRVQQLVTHFKELYISPDSRLHRRVVTKWKIINKCFQKP